LPSVGERSLRSVGERSLLSVGKRALRSLGERSLRGLGGAAAQPRRALKGDDSVTERHYIARGSRLALELAPPRMPALSVRLWQTCGHFRSALLAASSLEGGAAAALHGSAATVVPYPPFPFGAGGPTTSYPPACRWE